MKEAGGKESGPPTWELCRQRGCVQGAFHDALLLIRVTVRCHIQPQV